MTAAIFWLVVTAGVVWVAVGVVWVAVIAGCRRVTKVIPGGVLIGCPAWWVYVGRRLGIPAWWPRIPRRHRYIGPLGHGTIMAWLGFRWGFRDDEVV